MVTESDVLDFLNLVEHFYIDSKVTKLIPN